MPNRHSGAYASLALATVDVMQLIERRRYTVSELIMIEDTMPEALQNAMASLQDAVRGKPVSAEQHANISAAFGRYGIIGVNGEPVAWGNATRADHQAALLRTEIRMKHAELALLQVETEMELGSAK
jgi:hypothetical protein